MFLSQPAGLRHGSHVRLMLAVMPIGILALLFFAGSALADYTTPGGGGDITPAAIALNSSAVVLVSPSPPTYDVLANLTISAGDTLVLAPGTHLRFANLTRLTVLGGLRAQGTAAAHVALDLRPSGSPDLSAWNGLYADGPSAFELRNVSFAGQLDITYSNGAGAVLDNVTYQGRMTMENATGARLSGLVETANPYDTGRPPLWVFNSSGVEVRNADLEGGYGWGDIPSFHLFQSTNVRAWNMTMRADSFQIEGITVERSFDVRVYGLHIKPGPGGGVPGPALEAISSSDVWVEGITIEGEPLAGALYGTDANVTVANSTLDNYTVQGAWSGMGRLVAVNVSALNVGATAGAEVWDYRLLQVEARFGSGRLIGAGVATVENGTLRLVAPMVAGRSDWLWALAVVNRSGTQEYSLNYAVVVTCNCSAGNAIAGLAGSSSLVVPVTVMDAQPPVAAAPSVSGTTGGSLVLTATGSQDNDGLLSYSWSVASGVNVTGLPCITAVCNVTFETPGNHSLNLTVRDFSGNALTIMVLASIQDTRAPSVAIVQVAPQRPGQNQPFVVRANVSDNDPRFLPATEWYFDGVRATAAGLGPMFFTDVVGNHTIRLVVRDDANNSAEASIVVYVRDSMPPSIGALNASRSLHAGDQATIDASAQTSDNIAVVSWHWRVQGPFTDYGLTGPVVNATFPAAGTYLVSVSVADAEGNTANRSFEVVVLPAASPQDDTILWVALGVASIGAVAGATLVLQRSRRR